MTFKGVGTSFHCVVGRFLLFLGRVSNKLIYVFKAVLDDVKLI